MILSMQFTLRWLCTPAAAYKQVVPFEGPTEDLQPFQPAIKPKGTPLLPETDREVAINAAILSKLHLKVIYPQNVARDPSVGLLFLVENISIISGAEENNAMNWLRAYAQNIATDMPALALWTKSLANVFQLVIDSPSYSFTPMHFFGLVWITLNGLQRMCHASQPHSTDLFVRTMLLENVATIMVLFSRFVNSLHSTSSTGTSQKRVVTKEITGLSNIHAAISIMCMKCLNHIILQDHVNSIQDCRNKQICDILEAVIHVIHSGVLLSTAGSQAPTLLVPAARLLSHCVSPAVALQDECKCTKALILLSSRSLAVFLDQLAMRFCNVAATAMTANAGSHKSDFVPIESQSLPVDTHYQLASVKALLDQLHLNWAHKQKQVSLEFVTVLVGTLYRCILTLDGAFWKRIVSWLVHTTEFESAPAPVRAAEQARIRLISILLRSLLNERFYSIIAKVYVLCPPALSGAMDHCLSEYTRAVREERSIVDRRKHDARITTSARDMHDKREASVTSPVMLRPGASPMHLPTVSAPKSIGSFPSMSPSPLDQPFQVHDAVEGLCRVQNGTERWFPGTINAVHADKRTYDITYKDGEVQLDKPHKEIRFPRKRGDSRERKPVTIPVSKGASPRQEGSWHSVSVASMGQETSVAPLSKSFPRSEIKESNTKIAAEMFSATQAQEHEVTLLDDEDIDAYVEHGDLAESGESLENIIISKSFNNHPLTATLARQSVVEGNEDDSDEEFIFEIPSVFGEANRMDAVQGYQRIVPKMHFGNLNLSSSLSLTASGSSLSGALIRDTPSNVPPLSGGHRAINSHRNLDTGRASLCGGIATGRSSCTAPAHGLNAAEFSATGRVSELTTVSGGAKLGHGDSLAGSGSDHAFDCAAGCLSNWDCLCECVPCDQSAVQTTASNGSQLFLTTASLSTVEVCDPTRNVPADEKPTVAPALEVIPSLSQSVYNTLYGIVVNLLRKRAAQLYGMDIDRAVLESAPATSSPRTITNTAFPAGVDCYAVHHDDTYNRVVHSLFGLREFFETEMGRSIGAAARQVIRQNMEQLLQASKQHIFAAEEAQWLSMSTLLPLLTVDDNFPPCLEHHLDQGGRRIGEGVMGSVYKVACDGDCAWKGSELLGRFGSFAIKRIRREQSLMDLPRLLQVFNEILCTRKVMYLKSGNPHGFAFEKYKGVCQLTAFGAMDAEYWLMFELGVMNVRTWRRTMCVEELSERQEFPEAVEAESLLLTSLLGKQTAPWMLLWLLLYHEMVTIVRDIHSLGIIHFDLKCDNFILRRLPSLAELLAAYHSKKLSGYVCLTDFGEAVRVSDIVLEDSRYPFVVSQSKGTLCIQSPEMLQISSQHIPSFASDLWSLGCVAVELFTGEHLFKEYTWVDLFELLCKKQSVKVKRIDQKSIKHPNITLLKHLHEGDMHLLPLDTLYWCLDSQELAGVVAPLCTLVGGLLTCDMNKRATVEMTEEKLSVCITTLQRKEMDLLTHCNSPVTTQSHRLLQLLEESPADYSLDVMTRAALSGPVWTVTCGSSTFPPGSILYCQPDLRGLVHFPDCEDWSEVLDNVKHGADAWETSVTPWHHLPQSDPKAASAGRSIKRIVPWDLSPLIHHTEGVATWIGSLIHHVFVAVQGEGEGRVHLTMNTAGNGNSDSLQCSLPMIGFLSVLRIISRITKHHWLQLFKVIPPVGRSRDALLGETIAWLVQEIDTCSVLHSFCISTTAEPLFPWKSFHWWCRYFLHVFLLHLRKDVVDIAAHTHS